MAVERGCDAQRALGVSGQRTSPSNQETVSRRQGRALSDLPNARTRIANGQAERGYGEAIQASCLIGYRHDKPNSAASHPAPNRKLSRDRTGAMSTFRSMRRRAV